MPVHAGDAAGVAVLGNAAGEADGMAGTPAAAAGDDIGKVTGTAQCHPSQSPECLFMLAMQLESLSLVMLRVKRMAWLARLQLLQETI
ncbi:UNVERIFIED_CONTAM: hypothetical protein FKN15_036953 [Acipenser sinensis]